MVRIMRPLKVLFPFHVNNRANSHVPVALCSHWRRQGLDVTLFAPSVDKELEKSLPGLFKPALRSIRKNLAYRLGGLDYTRRAAERLFLKSLGGGDVAYLWAGGIAPDVAEQVKTRSAPLVLERINCNQVWSRKRLDSAYAVLGMQPGHGITEQGIESERRKLQLADHIFCPSPLVRQSLQDEGVAEEKLMQTSYGWAPERFSDAGTPRLRFSDSPTFLFVGMLCVRKGIPVLLEAWEQARINGRLILCGRVLDELDKRFVKQLARPDVRLMSHTDAIGELYGRADYFVFPSLEEGGPLVTYEAMAHGAVPMVSPMGAGAVVRKGKDGFVVEETTVEAWSNALRSAMEIPSGELHRMSLAAIERAGDFTWERVAYRRAQLLEERVR